MLKNKTEVNEIINKYAGRKGALIPILQEVQKIEKYLAKETMKYIADKTGIKLAEIYGVATFYTMFRLSPQGKHIIRICKGTACHVSGANSIAETIRKELKLNNNEDTTKNNLFTVMEVACLGCCSLAPVIMIDEDTHGKLTPESIPTILKQYQ